MIGHALMEVAVREGNEIYAIIRPGTKRKDRIINSPKVHLVYSELDTLSRIGSITEKCDVLYHFAWAGTEKEKRDDPIVQEKNIRYTLDAVELAEKCGCSRFVGVGSQAEYGFVDGRIDENTKYAPILSYGSAKYAASIMSRKLCEKKSIDHVWGRVFSVYGPHDNEGTMLDYAIKCWNKGEIAKFSSGKQYWNYLYESDAGEMFYRLGDYRIKEGIYFIAHYNSLPLREYIEQMMDVYGKDIKAEFEQRNSVNVNGLSVKMDDMIQRIGYMPKIEFREGIRKMIEARSV